MFVPKMLQKKVKKKNPMTFIVIEKSNLLFCCLYVR